MRQRRKEEEKEQTIVSEKRATKKATKEPLLSRLFSYVQLTAALITALCIVGYLLNRFAFPGVTERGVVVALRAGEGRSLRLVCNGRKASPTLLFVPGATLGSIHYATLMEALPQRACAYDRDGRNGVATPTTKKNAAFNVTAPATLTSDLADVIKALGETPVVLVAHSAGALIAELLLLSAAPRAANVAALVLLEPSSHGGWDSALYTEMTMALHHAAKLGEGAAAVGLFRVAPLAAAGIDARLPAALHDEARAMLSSDAYWQLAFGAEAFMLRELAQATTTALAAAGGVGAFKASAPPIFGIFSDHRRVDVLPFFTEAKHRRFIGMQWSLDHFTLRIVQDFQIVHESSHMSVLFEAETVEALKRFIGKI